jgi:hypothetical protein
MEDPMQADSCEWPDAESIQRVEIGRETDDAAFAAWEDGDVVEVVWGPQGGAMVAVRYRVEGESLDCMPQHTAIRDAAGTYVLESTRPLRLYPEGEGVYMTQPHWLRFPPDHEPRAQTSLELEAHVGAMTATAQLWIDEAPARRTSFD